MTAPQRRHTIPSIIRDHHTRIRRLEASPGDGGGSGGDCPDCVMCPFCVNPGDISVPEAYRNCVDITGAVESNPVDTCGTGNVFIVSSLPIGFCSAYGLGQPLGLQLRADVLFGPCNVSLYGPTANISNLILYAGNPETQVASFIWDVAGTPNQSPCAFDTGWVDVGAVCGASCTAITASVSFNPHSSFGGACGQGNLGARWVVLNDEDEYRGALDDLPQAEDGDVVHFDSRTHEWTDGPARRRTAIFMG